MLSRLRNRFLTRLSPPKDIGEWLRVERVLASVRVFLTLTALVAVYVDPTEPTQYAEVAYAILIAYCVWGIAVWVIVHRSDEIDALRHVIHVLDIAFPIVFMLFTAGPNSPFFVFLMFVMISASFRWGFPETMLTAAVVTVLLVVEAAVLSYGPRHGWIEGQYEVNRFVIRVGYLLTLGVLVGYLGEEEKQWRAENSSINRLLGRVHAETGLRQSMEEVLSELLRVSGAAKALVVLNQAGTGRMFLWHMNEEDGIAHGREVEADARSHFDAILPANALYAARQGSRWRCWAISADARKLKLLPSYDPAILPETNGMTSVMAVSVAIGEEWSGCIFLHDAQVGPYVYSELRFVQNVMRHIGPALYTVFLVRRLRSRAGAIERARVARELHDGAIQALISVEMQVDVLRRRLTSPENAVVADGLTRVQGLLREQVFELRMLMQQMKPVEFSPGQLLDYMADMVDRFRRDTGIGAQFVTSLEEVQVSARVAREIVRMLQEALVNIRKHSGASNVQVRFAAENGCWKLGIVDNGRGFDFSGRFSLQELDASRRGPAIIKERVRSLGGQMAVQSTPNVGSELEITLPQKTQKAYV